MLTAHSQRPRSHLGRISVASPLQLHTGYRQTVIVGAMGAMAQLDTAYKVVQKPSSLVEILAQYLNKPAERLNLADFSSAAHRLKKEGLSWKLTATYTNRQFKFRGIDSKGAKDDMFQVCRFPTSPPHLPPSMAFRKLL